MFENIASLEGSVQEKLEADSEFQASLASLSEEEKDVAVKAKKSELIDATLKEFSETSKKNKELADNYKIRAEKAESEAKKNKTTGDVTPKTSEISTRDVIALTKANVAEEDIDEIVDYAKYKGISVAEALKSDVIKISLERKAEQRKTAEATNVGTSRRGSGKIPDDVLLSNAQKGIMPESDEDLNRLFNLRKGIKK